jgi:hypothetical protein
MGDISLETAISDYQQRAIYMLTTTFLIFAGRHFIILSLSILLIVDLHGKTFY